GEKSVILILRHMPLTDEEITAISWHMGAFDSRAGAGRSLSSAWEKCPLALHLHLADMEATWFDEKRGPQK
ncbi:MAG: hydrolase, partial [Akkermansia muciniphila]